jgi:hypothetical protein
MAVGQMVVCVVCLPGALPLAMLTMAFGQLGFFANGDVHHSLGHRPRTGLRFVFTAN